MKAKKFIEKFGWCEANKFIGWYGGDTAFKYIKVKEYTVSVHSGDQPYDFHINDLKQYTDAWELVNRFGGLSGAKGEYFEVVHSGKYKDVSPVDLSKAIQLVESVEVKNESTH